MVLRERGKIEGRTINLKRRLWRGDLLLVILHSSKFLVTSALFSPLLPVMSHPQQNPCITKQLDQKPPVMQQGSYAPYLLPRWEMEGERVSGREGRRIWEGGRGGRTARTGVWLTDQHSHFSAIKSLWVFLLKNFALYLLSLFTCQFEFITSALMQMFALREVDDD